jgi:hypothetical protein
MILWVIIYENQWKLFSRVALMEFDDYQREAVAAYWRLHRLPFGKAYSVSQITYFWNYCEC